MAKKITLWVCVSLIVVIMGLAVCLALTTVYIAPKYNDPNIIFVYENGVQSTHLQATRHDQQEGEVNYSTIYEDVKKSFKQNSLKALFNGTLLKKYRVENAENQSKDISNGTFVIFYYNESPQKVVNAKGKQIGNSTYTSMLMELNPSLGENDAYEITLYLGEFDGIKTFNYSHIYKTVGNFTNLIYNLNK